MAGGNSWWVTSAPMPFPGGTVEAGGGGSLGSSPGYTGDSGFYRSRLDALRSGGNQGPDAQYPDGYLGTITDRREGRLIGEVQKRLTSRSYQRGVHKGEKIGVDGYYWTDEMSPDMGLERQAATTIPSGNVLLSERYAPTGNPVERIVHMGKTAGMSPPEQERVARQYGVDVGKNALPMTMGPTDRAMLAQQFKNVLPRYSGVFRAS